MAMTAHWAPILLAIGISLSDAKASSPWSIGTWEYSGRSVWVTVHLAEDGRCLVSAQRGRDPSITFIECTFSVRGDVVLLQSTPRPGEQALEPARLYYDALGDTFSAEGEPDLVLTRKKVRR